MTDTERAEGLYRVELYLPKMGGWYVPTTIRATSRVNAEVMAAALAASGSTVHVVTA